MTDKNKKKLLFYCFLLALSLLGFFFSQYYSIITKSLGNINFFYPKFVVLIGFLLWILVLWSQFQDFSQDNNKPKPYLYEIIPVLCLFAALIVLWMEVFYLEIAILYFLFGMIIVTPITILLFKLLVNCCPLAKKFIERTDTFFLKGSKFFFALFVLFLSIIALEIGFRAISKTMPARGESDYGNRPDFVLSPYLMFAEPNEKEGGSLNSQGFQGEELQKKKNGEKRIAILGGSAVWAGKNKNSIASFLQKFLRENYSDKEIRVINYGRQSYISMQELILLQRNVLPLDFDLIIIYDGYNDIHIPCFAEPKGVGYPFLYSKLKQRVELSQQLFNTHYFLKYLASKSSICRYIYQISTASPPKLIASQEFDIEVCAKEYQRNLFQMAKLAQAYQSEIILSVQPFVGYKDHKTEKESSFLSGGLLEDMVSYYKVIDQTARQVAQETKAHYIETLNVFSSEKSDIFIDPVHIERDTGNSIVAKYLAQEIIQKKFLD